MHDHARRKSITRLKIDIYKLSKTIGSHIYQIRGSMSDYTIVRSMPNFEASTNDSRSISSDFGLESVPSSLADSQNCFNIALVI
jgi:hypothetical protein